MKTTQFGKATAVNFKESNLWQMISFEESAALAGGSSSTPPTPPDVPDGVFPIRPSLGLPGIGC
ncbi:MAG: hypothetical protein AAGD25_18875 [Cyanobacteria bacterium P01_F01_bin.150]